MSISWLLLSNPFATKPILLVTHQMKHSAVASSSALDGYDFADASEETVDECKRRSNCNREKPKRQQRVMTSSDAFDFKSQDAAAFAHLLADHFVAREASNVSPKSQQQLARPVAGAVGLGSFRSWQFGERCLATYRVLFGRPLWAATTPTSVPQASSRPRKRKHVTPPTTSSSSSSESSDGCDGVVELQGGSGELLMVLPTVDELLELPTDDTFEFGGKAATPFEDEDVLAGLAMGLDGDATEADSFDLLWELDACEVPIAGNVLLTEGEEEELRFLTSSPTAFAAVSPGGEDMNDI